MLLYKQVKTINSSQIKTLLKFFLKEDMSEKDITTQTCIPKNKIGRATINARQEMVFCGEPVISNIFSKKIKIKQKRKDGEIVRKGQKIAEISGPLTEILTKERVLLNLIQRMSGISTLTQKYIEKLNNKKIHILDTRKTTPSLRQLEKYSVYKGGGSNHRLNLSTGLLIKDNHIAIAGKDIWEQAKKKNIKQPIQIEIDKINQITTTNIEMTNGYLLDNMTPTQIKKCIEKIKKLNKKNKQIFIEVSGGINLKSIYKYNIRGVNGISVGSLTHQAQSVDIGLDIK